MKHKISFILPIIVLLIASCSSDDIPEVEALDETAHFTPIGNPIEVNLSLSPLPFTIDEETRAEEPMEYQPTTKNELALLETEKEIDNFWVFEYDQETEELIYKPQYITVTNQATLSDGSISVTLSDNYGKPVTIYVVADGDAGTNESSKSSSSTCYSGQWVKEETGTYPGFETIKELEANTLPTQYVYKATYLNKWPPHESFFQNGYDERYSNDYKNIPKSGSTDLDVLKEGDTISVGLSSMYAKLLIYYDLYDELMKIFSSSDLSSIAFYIENLPCYCTVGALGNEYTTIPASYPESVHWTYWGYPGDGYNSVIIRDFDVNDVILAVYVPENIQGENGESNSSKTINAPSSQISSKDVDVPATNYENGQRPLPTDMAVVSEKTDAIAVHFSFHSGSSNSYGWYGPLYPGGNKTTNFNVRRNCTYRVIFDIIENEE